MIKNIWILLGKKLSGEASPEELLELEELLKQSLADQYEMPVLEQMWKADLQEHVEDQSAAKWDAFEVKLRAHNDTEVIDATTDSAPAANSKSGIIKLIRYTALIAACILIVLFFYDRRAVPTPGKPNEITAPIRGISKIQLTDGTRVWLNSGSKLVYQSDYGSEFRKVYLVGEALFDVVKDEKHPFIVTTPTISIRVLGTRFNVRSYNKDKSCETSLIRGRIELTVLKNPEKKIILKASDKLTVTDSEHQPVNTERPADHRVGSIPEEIPLIALSRVHQAKRDTLPSEALWVEDKLAFDAEDFESLALKIDQRYNVSIRFNNEFLKKLRFTGKFQNESIGLALKELQTTYKFHYKTTNNQILIY